MTETPKKTLPDLSGFTGSEEFYRHSLVRSVVYTEGVKHLADDVGAHWLLDLIASHQMEPKVRGEEFQLWKLLVSHGQATASCEDGNGNEVARQYIEMTDFPEPGIQLYCNVGEVGGHNVRVIMLPSEY